MSRPPIPPTDLVGDYALTTNPVADLQTGQLLEQALAEGREIGKEEGIIETALFAKCIFEKVIAETAIRARKNKNYKKLTYLDENQNRKFFTNFDEYCRIRFDLGARRVSQLIENYHLVGPELFEQAKRIGLRQHDYDAIRALPPEDQDLIKQAIESGERDRLIDLMQEMAIKHGSEKAAAKAEKERLDARLEAELAGRKADSEYYSRKRADLEKTIDELNLELHNEKAKPPEIRGEAAIAALEKTARLLASRNTAELCRDIRAVFDAMEDGFHTETAKNAMLGAFHTVIAGVRDAAIEHGLIGHLDGLFPPNPQAPASAD